MAFFGRDDIITSLKKITGRDSIDGRIWLRTQKKLSATSAWWGSQFQDVSRTNVGPSAGSFVPGQGRQSKVYKNLKHIRRNLTNSSVALMADLTRQVPLPL